MKLKRNAGLSATDDGMVRLVMGNTGRGLVDFSAMFMVNVSTLMFCLMELFWASKIISGLG